MGEECGDHIGEQRQREPLEDLEDGGIRDEELHPDDQQGNGHHQPECVDGAAREELPPGGHRAQIRSNIEGVRNQEPENPDADQPGGKLATQAHPQPHARLQRNTAAQLLDCRHQGESKEGGPQQAEAELAPDLRVGADPARVVVACPGDEPRSKQLEKARRTALFRLLDAGPAGGRRAARGQVGRFLVMLDQLVARRLRLWLHDGQDRVLDQPIRPGLSHGSSAARQPAWFPTCIVILTLSSGRGNGGPRAYWGTGHNSRAGGAL